MGALARQRSPVGAQEYSKLINRRHGKVLLRLRWRRIAAITNETEVISAVARSPSLEPSAAVTKVTLVYCPRNVQGDV